MAAIFSQLLRVLWLPVASFFAGILNSIAGGGSFLSLPALLASGSAAGVGAVTAQATNTVALWPGQLSALVAFRKQLREFGWKLLPLGVASGVGGEIGGWLLLRTGNRMFREILPWLLLFAAIMFALSFPWAAGCRPSPAGSVTTPGSSSARWWSASMWATSVRAADFW